ncbi:hypothetical protein [Actinocorallia aurantiaca]|uniref:Uncharacterized protein n=1 Tax=Actinocorallia aurantiaca TaxID=46204 RepID=A0ABP6HAI8_9ACTN
MTEAIKLPRNLALYLLEEGDLESPEPMDGYAFEAVQDCGSSRWSSHHRLIIRRESDGALFASEDYHRGLTENQEDDYWSGDYYGVEEEGFIHFHPVEKVALTTYEYKQVGK